MAAVQRGKDPPERRASAHGDHVDPWIIEPVPKGLVDSPLEFIFAEHHRQREAAAILTMVADGEFNRRGVSELIEFLEHDFALHVGDEECVLFPVLRLHCLPEDNVERVIDDLQQEHRADEAFGETVIAILKRRLQGQLLAGEASRRLRSFAEHVRQHLAVENSILLPIARARLNSDVLKALADMLRDRRRRVR
jgi:hemerythrin-like domain-containing protein